ncbi:hypothetical protein ACGC1H_002421 [Rhizoctonia solani]
MAHLPQGKTRKGNSFKVEGKVSMVQGNVPVNWPVSNSDDWKDSGISKTKSILLYRLRKNKPGSMYDWKLEFINTAGWGFTFTDASPDSYSITTFRSGVHKLEYNSAHPTITQVN